MRAASAIHTYFIGVPSGATVAPHALLLNVRVLVEWLMPSDTAVPSWLEHWVKTASDLGLEVALSNSTGLVIASGKASCGPPSGERSAPFMAGPLGEPVRAEGPIIDVARVKKASTNRAVAFVRGQQPEAVHESAAADFVHAFQEERDNWAAPVAQAITSRAATRYPEVGQLARVAFNVTLELPGWKDYVDAALSLRCHVTWCSGQSPITGDVIEPFTQCTIRAAAGQVYWCPRLTEANAMAEPGMEGLIRMRGSVGQPEWALETLEYMSADLQDRTEGNTLVKAGRPLEDTDGLALICIGIRDFMTVPGLEGERNGVPVLGWRDLLAGFRVDVAGESVWHSLSLRTVSLGDHRVDDEGVFEIGTVHVPNVPEPWWFEEVGRWDGTGLTPATQEVVFGYDVAVIPRPAPAARLRWGKAYAMGLRPVFKGGWSLSLPAATVLRSCEAPNCLAWRTGDTTFLREERLGPPEIKGLAVQGDVHRIHCSLDGHDVPQHYTINLSPPRVSNRLVKRSGVLDRFSSSKAQEKVLHDAAAAYSDAKAVDTESRGRFYPDPWADAVEIEIALAGTSSSVICSVVSEDSTAELRHGERRIARLPWRRPGKWPAFRPIEFTLAAAARSRITIGGSSVLLEVAPGDHADIAISCSISDDKVAEAFALGRRIVEALTPDELVTDDMRRRAKASLVDSILLDVRHATRKPLEPPQMTQPVMYREANRLDAVFEDVVRVDRQTTSEVCLEANWFDWEPDGDRMVRTAKGFTNPPTATLSMVADADYGNAGETAQMEPMRLQIPLPDTRHRVFEARLRGEPRYGSLFKGAAESVIGRTERVSVPNVAVREAPSISIVVPAMTTRTTTQDEYRRRESWRYSFSGNTLRAYLGTRWQLSGDNEVLGVVCAPESQDALSDAARKALKQYYSQWGSEVLIATQRVLDGPFARHFTAASVMFDGVLSSTGAEGDKPVPALIAGHLVQYDEDAREYYADIVVSGHGSDYPWVRLALVRLQPNSVPGCHVSPTVSAQFTQPLADRWIAASESPLDRLVLRVSASCTAALQEPGLLAGLSATIDVLRSDSGISHGVLHGGQLWSQVCQLDLALYPHSSSSTPRFWLAELRLQDRQDVLLRVREYFTPQKRGGESDYEKLLRWEGLLVIER